MAVFHPHVVECACGNTITVHLADTINVRRSPEMRARILNGELHRAACPKCGEQFTVEKPFYYTDFDRNLVLKVLPRGERHTWKEASAEVERASALIPDQPSEAYRERSLRVVFGLDELREKLVAQDASIDDRILELLKVRVVHEHPVLLKWARLRLTLTQVTEKALQFSACYEHSQRHFQVDLPRPVAENYGARQEELQQWTKKAHRQSIFEQSDDHWVNMWRWSPQPSALDQLRTYAAQAKAGRTIDTDAAAFKTMLRGLPRGNHLPGWAKEDLQTLFKYAKSKRLEALEDQLFEIRFNITLEDDWSKNEDPNDIDTLWQLLRDLPDSNVEGNAKIREILLDVGKGGGLYFPTTHDIAIGSRELSTRERFEDVVRHEVGHAVHEQSAQLVNGWLQEQFGWRPFGTGDGEIDQWVQLMGGWGDLTAAQRADVRNALRTALGGGSSWSPGPTPALPPGHPWYKPDFGPRLAFEKTGASWFRNFRTWHRANGKAFFLNYWYRVLYVVDTAALDLVAQMPDAYASMSQYQFFAELYALYFDLDDPKRSVIPATVASWLKTNIGAPEAPALMAMAMAPEAKKEWETITRPA